MAAFPDSMRNRVVSRVLLAVAILLGAFATTSAITGWVYLRGGPIVTDLGRINGGAESRSLLLEIDGVQLDIAVPLIDWWGESQIVTQAVNPGQNFLGANSVQDARDYLSGSSYAAARPAGDGSWKVFPVPGQGAPADPAARQWYVSSQGRTARINAPGADSAVVAVRMDGESPIIVDISVEFYSPHARWYVLLFAILAAACFGLALFLVIKDPLRPRRPRKRASSFTTRRSPPTQSSQSPTPSVLFDFWRCPYWSGSS